MDDRELDRRLTELYQICEDTQFLLTLVCEKLGIDIDKEIKKQQTNIETEEEYDNEDETETEEEYEVEREFTKKEKAEQLKKYDIQIQKPYKKQ